VGIVGLSAVDGLLHRIQAQSKFPQPCLEILQKTIHISLILEIPDGIVRMANHYHVASRIPLAPEVQPKTENIMEIDIGEDL
jgi:hypothetical protein